MTKEQKYPLAEPASYAPPQMEVIPLRGNSAMLIGSLVGTLNESTGLMDFEYVENNSATDNYIDAGWSDNLFD